MLGTYTNASHNYIHVESEHLNELRKIYNK